jgi:hypothetical protein
MIAHHEFRGLSDHIGKLSSQRDGGRQVTEIPVLAGLRETLGSWGHRMNSASFGWKEKEPLAGELVRPITQVSIKFAFHGRPAYVTLWRPDETGLLINSDMQDVAERREVGVLQFSRVLAAETQEMVIEASSVFSENLSVSKLAIEESGTESESGIILQASSGEEIVIVAGVTPYSIAVRGLTWPEYTFEPEYPMEQYSRIAFG